MKEGKKEGNKSPVYQTGGLSERAKLLGTSSWLPTQLACVYRKQSRIPPSLQGKDSSCLWKGNRLQALPTVACPLLEKQNPSP